jgi:hypothetical protein
VTPGTRESRKDQAKAKAKAIHDKQCPVECNHTGILEHSLPVESRGMVASSDN